MDTDTLTKVIEDALTSYGFGIKYGRDVAEHIAKHVRDDIIHPDHAVVLTTEEGFENAPNGTVIAEYDDDGENTVLVKIGGDWLAPGVPWTFLDAELAGRTHEILRWGGADD